MKPWEFISLVFALAVVLRIAERIGDVFFWKVRWHFEKRKAGRKVAESLGQIDRVKDCMQGNFHRLYSGMHTSGASSTPVDAVNGLPRTGRTKP